jgi:serine/threonine-protein kinase
MPRTNQLNIALSGRYVIERELGQGGMATVYLAQDVRHDRKVALKVLRPELAAVIGAERFLQEIKVTANLQHPHILPLFDSGHAEVPGTRGGGGEALYYVMPYVEGESLRDLLTREKQLPIEQAVRIAAEVADALDYAHRHAVVHRDIKPENILLHDGRAAVSDFGIALAVSTAGGTRMTETGLSLGTPHYMSPEQAMGDRELNARSDVYALGATLYEMLAGEPPFTGPSAQAVVARVMTESPRGLRIQRHTVPQHVEAAVMRALEKLPADRFATAAEFATALDRPVLRATGGPAAAVAPATRQRGPALALAVSATVVMALVAAWGWLRPPPPQPVSRFVIQLADFVLSYASDAPAISPDGLRIVYANGEGQLLLRPRDRLETTAVPDASTGWAPFFSPDGQQLAFTTGFPGALKVVPIGGGGTRVLVADSTYATGGSWSDDGWIYYVGGPAAGLRIMRVRAEGGTPEAVATPDRARGELFYYWPEALPGGRTVLVTVWRRQGEPDIAAVDVASGAVTVLTRGVRALYAPTSHLLVVRGDGTLVAARFAPGNATIEGEFVPVIDGIWIGGQGRTPVAFSRSGTLLYQGSPPEHEMVRVARDGSVQVIDPNWRGRFTSLSLSPDGTRLAVGFEQAGRTELWAKTLPTGPFTRLAFEGTVNYRPSWSPDGHSVLFVSDRTGRTAVYRMPADGSGEPEVVIDNPRGVDEGVISADGRAMVYRIGSGGGRDVVGRRTGVDSAPVPLAASEFEEFSPTLSPNNRWLAYASDEAGRTELYVRPFPDAGSARWQISRGGGSEPLWSHSGNELFYRSGNGDLIAVRVAPGPTFAVQSERALFSAREYLTDNRHRSYSVNAGDDAFYFVRVRDAVTSGSSRITVVLNWFEELRRMVDR